MFNKIEFNLIEILKITTISVSKPSDDLLNLDIEIYMDSSRNSSNFSDTSSINGFNLCKLLIICILYIISNNISFIINMGIYCYNIYYNINIK